MCQTAIHFDRHLEPIRENGDMSGVTRLVLSQRRIKLNRGEWHWQRGQGGATPR